MARQAHRSGLLGPWRVRPGRPGDEGFLVAMLREAASWNPDEPRRSVEAVAADPVASRYVAGWGRAGDVAAVAVDAEERPLGAAWYRSFDAAAPAYGFVDAATPELAIGVAPEHRGRGIGWALLWALLFEAAGSGVPALSLSVARANPAARLYWRLGFVPVGETGGSWTMRRDLVRLPQLRMVYPPGRAAPVAAAPAAYALRPFVAADERSFYGLMERAGWPGWDAARLRPYAERLAPDGWVVVVHEDTGELVASAMALLDDPEDPSVGGEVSWVAADPRHAGRGLGAAVAAAVTARLLDLGCRRVHLSTEDFRLAAIRTYERLGYAPVVDEPPVAERWREIGRRLGWSPGMVP